MIYYDNPRTVPAFNLAAEEFFLTFASEREPIFLLWQNAPSVIVGRNQNALEEVNLPFIEKRRIPVIRRLSGGGAVYHDSGNLNYSFIVPEAQTSTNPGVGPDFETWTRPVQNLLTRLGLSVEFSGRNDLTLNGKKFSGSAQARSHGRLLHHGTLLFATNFDDMTEALSVRADKFLSKGVASVRSRVTNLADHLPAGFSLDEFKKELLHEIETNHAEDFEIRNLSPDQIAKIEKSRIEKYETREWNFGKSPQSNFSAERRFSWGKLRVDLFLERGKIAATTFSGDFFTNGDPERLAESLVGLDYDIGGVHRAITDEMIRTVFPALSRDDFFALLFE